MLLSSLLRRVRLQKSQSSFAERSCCRPSSAAKFFCQNTPTVFLYCMPEKEKNVKTPQRASSPRGVLFIRYISYIVRYVSTRAQQTFPHCGQTDLRPSERFDCGGAIFRFEYTAARHDDVRPRRLCGDHRFGVDPAVDFHMAVQIFFID